KLDPAPWLPAEASPQTQVTFANTLLSLPDLDLKVPHIEPTDLADRSSLIGRSIRGVMGDDILSLFVVELEYDRSAVHFDEPNAFQYSGKGVILPLFVRDGVPRIRAKLKIPGQPGFDDEFEVRTDFNGAIALSKPFAAAHRIRVGHFKGFSFPDAAGNKTQFARAHSFSFGHFAFNDAIVEFP